MSRFPAFTLDGQRYVVVPAELAAEKGLTRETAAQRRRRALATRLRAARDAAGLTQVELGERLGVKQSTIARTETGRDAVSAQRAAAWLEACGLAPDWRPE